MTNFIFFLTYNDVTVWNAIEVFEEIKDAGVMNIGFKDVGLSSDKLKILANNIRKAGRKIFLEVVSGTREANLRSAKTAVEMDVDYLIGGTYIEPTFKVLRGTKVKYFPYIGKVIGHPCLLRGSIDEIVDHAKKVEALGADGIDLLAYRYDGDVDRLITSVQRAVDIPVILAGSINSLERIRHVIELEAWGFTIGSAIFDKKIVPDGDLGDQIHAVMEEIGRSRSV